MIFIKFIISLVLLSKINLSPICKEPLNHCVNCNPVTNLCSKCSYPDILIPDDNGGCKGAKKCIEGKNLCLECDQNGKLCEKCEKNYYQDGNGGCTYSEGCEISYRGECIQCESDYILIGKDDNLKICKYLQTEIYKNCEKINTETGMCEKCEQDYYLSSEQKCVKVEHCKESIFGVCISCVYSYYYDKKEEKCKKKEENEDFYFCKQTIDGEKCDICDDGFYLDEQGFCVPTKYCLESYKLQCTKCLPGYYLSNNNYCSIANNCDYVDVHSFICTFCNKNYYLDMNNYICKSNLEDNEYKHCKKVLNNKCILCENDYYPTEDGKCSNTKNCLESEYGICLLCLDNYYLDRNNICTDIKNCIYSKYDECLECEDNYYYNRINRTCIESDINYENCKSTCYYDEKCCECKNNYYLNKKNNSCYDNNEDGPFYKCVYTDNLGEKCEECIEDYYLGTEDNKCTKIENCKISENEEKCLECDDYFCLDKKRQICIYNKDINLEDENGIIFYNCLLTNNEGTKCEKCINGYEVGEEGFCIDNNFCEEKSEDGICLKCKEKINDDEYNHCLNQKLGCLEIKVDNCLRCDNLENLYECTECKEGYEKINNKCESQISEDENI